MSKRFVVTATVTYDVEARSVDHAVKLIESHILYDHERMMSSPEDVTHEFRARKQLTAVKAKTPGKS